MRPPRVAWLSLLIALGLAIVTPMLAAMQSASGGGETMPHLLGVILLILIWVYRLDIRSVHSQEVS